MIRWVKAVLLRNRRGSTIVELAIVLPVMMLMIMGLGDLLFQEYAQSILTGAVQKAGRDSSIQSANTSMIDAAVIGVTSSLVATPTQACPSSAAATWCSTRYSYDTFTEVAPEPFVDADKDGMCDHGESFTDVNANNHWDANPGASGQGGAGAVTLYTMTLTYKRLFPMATMLGWPANATITASTLLKNQPYASQTMTTAIQGTCK